METVALRSIGHQSAKRLHLPAKKSHGAADRNRTRNLLFTKQLLCQLSYGGVVNRA